MDTFGFGPTSSPGGPLADSMMAEFVGFLEAKICDRITKYLKGLAYQYRDIPFTLSSGKKSNHYVDAKRVLLDPRVLDPMSHWLLSKALSTKSTIIGGTELGAVPLVAACVSTAYAAKLPLGGFIVRKEVKDHGTQKLIEGPEFAPGMKCVIVDDVLTTGTNLLHAISAAKDFGLDVVKVLVILDREEGGKETLLSAGYSVESATTLRKVIEADIGPESSGDKAANTGG